MPKCYREAATLMSRRHENVRQQGKNIGWCLSVCFFLSLSRFLGLSCLCIPSRIAVSGPLKAMTSVLITFSPSLSQCPRFLSMILRGQQKKKKRITEHPELQQNRKRCSVVSFSQNSEKWNQPPSSTSSHTTFPFLFYQYPSCVLVFLTWNSGTTWGPISISPD